jgi:hypothetical protein
MVMFRSALLHKDCMWLKYWSRTIDKYIMVSKGFVLKLLWAYNINRVFVCLLP